MNKTANPILLPKKDVSLIRLNSWRTNSRAKEYFAPQTLAELSEYLRTKDEVKPTFLGLGSNVLIMDEAPVASVIHLGRGLRAIDDVTGKDVPCKGENTTLLRVEAGVTAAKLSRYAERMGLGGVAFMSGIPGTVGGAIRMTAGCFGSETWELVRAVELINADGEVKLFPASSFSVEYRKLKLPPDNWIVAGYFELEPEDSEVIRQKVTAILRQRSKSQPIGTFNCGSVFKNPSPTNSAGKLIESCDLKGFAIGDAMVSDIHANFIINRGFAKSIHILQLMKTIMTRVYDKYGLKLDPEVQIIGNIDESFW